MPPSSEKKSKKTAAIPGFKSLASFMSPRPPTDSKVEAKIPQMPITEEKKEKSKADQKEMPPPKAEVSSPPAPNIEPPPKSSSDSGQITPQKQEKKSTKKISKETKPPTKGESESDQKIEPINKETSPQSPDRPLKKQFFIGDTTPFGDAQANVAPDKESGESIKSYHLRLLQQSGKIVQDLDQGVLLTVEYDGGINKAYAKFYDLSDGSIKIWIDTTNHRPYCFHKSAKEDLEKSPELIGHPGFTGIESVKKMDLIRDREINVAKIYGKTPTDIGGANGIRGLLRSGISDLNPPPEGEEEEEAPEEDLGENGAWEANIRYHHNFIYDLGLIPGMFYQIIKGKIVPKMPLIDKKLEERLIQVFQKEAPEILEIAKTYYPIFSTPVPILKRVAYDIEVEETPNKGLPDPMTSKYKVISIAFAASDGLRLVYTLNRPELPEGAFPPEFPNETQVVFFNDEKTLLIEAFRVMWSYPIIITFNGDNFDNTYLYHRARNLKIDSALNPIYLERSSGMMIHQNTDFKQGVHIDIFQFFSNRSIKGYAFGGGYLRNSLEEVATALLGTGKVKHEGTLIGQMTLANLIHYNLNDAVITLELTTFNEQLAFHLMVVLMRITRLPMQDIFRVQISAWIRSLMFAEHRRKNILIPRSGELKQTGEEGFSHAVSDGKQFQGAYVIDPIPGIHFEVAVMDFSSLYPSIIKTRNLSYETINCLHPECRKNLLPNTPYWGCTKHMGIFAYVVGFLRDIRVKWFKPLSGDKTISKQDRQTAKVMASALKVFINGAYGVFGSPVFPLFCLRVAESTTAIGRFSIKKTIEQATQMGIKVLYGDSDSVFLLKPTEEQVNRIIEWAEKYLDLDLELDKTYQFLALSERKKNYIGVKKGTGEVDIKGLLVKKHNTPEFIKTKFSEVQEILQNIIDMDTFKLNRDKIIKIIRETSRLIGVAADKGGFEIEAYSFMVGLKKKIKAYTKTMPQHVKAAQMLPPEERDRLEPGDFITYIKTRNKDGVKPTSQTSISEIDHIKYKEMVKSTFEQLLDALGINYDEVLGIKKLTAFYK